jgi:hypothetical protein
MRPHYIQMPVGLETEEVKMMTRKKVAQEFKQIANNNEMYFLKH